ncbi:hypothetical protein SALBM311S_05737 [Streptomyces alboniger]
MTATRFGPCPDAAATEDQRRPWAKTDRRMVRGEVHDENAWALVGVAVAPRVRGWVGAGTGVSVLGTSRNRFLGVWAVLTRQPLRADTPVPSPSRRTRARAPVGGTPSRRTDGSPVQFPHRIAG